MVGRRAIAATRWPPAPPSRFTRHVRHLHMTPLCWTLRVAVAALVLPPLTTDAAAQGITTAAISGRVTDESGNPRADAQIIAIHLPSATTYQGRTRQDGRTTIPGMRVGGPYRVTATLLGFEPSVRDTVFLALGVVADLQFVMRRRSEERR